MYNNGYPYNINNNGDRIFFPFFPFVLGGLAGGALVSATRPRPVFVNPPYYNNYPSYGYNYYGGYNYRPYPYYR